jgi:glycerophosphoryl diester phosphodiesterase
VSGPRRRTFAFWPAAGLAALASVVAAACSTPDEPPLVIAHRGLRGAFPDNAVAGFLAAAAAGADVAETDLQLSADGVPVLAHDPRLECFTAGCTGAIAERAAADIAACPLPRAADGASHPVASFEAFLTATAGVFRRHFIEVKPNGPETAALARAAVQLAAQHGSYASTVWHSFHVAGLEAVRAAAAEAGLPPPVVGLQLLFDHGWSGGGACEAPAPDATEGDADRLAVDWVLWGAAFIDRLDVQQAHAAGRRVATWGGDAPALVTAALDLGVDGVFTDAPALLRARVGPPAP